MDTIITVVIIIITLATILTQHIIITHLLLIIIHGQLTHQTTITLIQVLTNIHLLIILTIIIIRIVTTVVTMIIIIDTFIKPAHIIITKIIIILTKLKIKLTNLVGFIFKFFNSYVNDLTSRGYEFSHAPSLQFDEFVHGSHQILLLLPQVCAVHRQLDRSAFQGFASPLEKALPILHGLHPEAVEH